MTEMKPVGQSLGVTIDQLVYARQREWMSTFGIVDRLKLRDLIIETVRPYTHPPKDPELKAMEALNQAVGLHEGIEVYYEVDGFEASLTAHDGATTLHSAKGATIRSALLNLNAILGEEG